MLIENIIITHMLSGRKRNIFFIGVFISLMGTIVGYILFPGEDLPIIFFTVMPLLPFINRLFSKNMRNTTIASMYGHLFLGMMAVFFIFNVIIQPEINVTANFSEDSYTVFSNILNNNARIVFILFLLSILYGVGSLFILSLNAAMISQFMYELFTFGNVTFLLASIPHVSVEFISFFLASISGAIVSVAFITYKKNANEFGRKMEQAAVFFSFSIFCVIFAAFLESFMVPVIIGV